MKACRGDDREHREKWRGMPVGPLSLSDEVALDLVLKIMRSDEADLGANAIDQTQKKLLVEMVEKQGRSPQERQGILRLSRKGQGFRKPVAGLERVAPNISILDPSTLRVESSVFSSCRRLEAARTVEDHVIVDPREADVGSIPGSALRVHGRNAVLHRFHGHQKFVELCTSWKPNTGLRFTPPKLLIDMAAKGETFLCRSREEGCG